MKLAGEKYMGPLAQSKAFHKARVRQTLGHTQGIEPEEHRTLCTIRVCIQNRRKDNAAVLVFPSRAQVITNASSTGAVLRGKVDTYDN